MGHGLDRPRREVRLEFEFNAHASQDSSKLVEQGPVASFPTDSKNKTRKVMVVFGVDSIFRQDKVVCFEKRVRGQSLTFGETLEILLRCNDDMMQNLDVFQLLVDAPNRKRGRAYLEQNNMILIRGKPTGSTGRPGWIALSGAAARA